MDDNAARTHWVASKIEKGKNGESWRLDDDRNRFLDLQKWRQREEVSSKARIRAYASSYEKKLLDKVEAEDACVGRGECALSSRAKLLLGEYASSSQKKMMFQKKMISGKTQAENARVGRCEVASPSDAWKESINFMAVQESCKLERSVDDAESCKSSPEPFIEATESFGILNYPKSPEYFPGSTNHECENSSSKAPATHEFISKLDLDMPPTRSRENGPQEFRSWPDWDTPGGYDRMKRSQEFRAIQHPDLDTPPGIDRKKRSEDFRAIQQPDLDTPPTRDREKRTRRRKRIVESDPEDVCLSDPEDCIPLAHRNFNFNSSGKHAWGNLICGDERMEIAEDCYDSAFIHVSAKSALSSPVQRDNHTFAMSYYERALFHASADMPPLDSSAGRDEPAELADDYTPGTTSGSHEKEGANSTGTDVPLWYRLDNFDNSPSCRDGDLKQDCTDIGKTHGGQSHIPSEVAEACEANNIGDASVRDNNEVAEACETNNIGDASVRDNNEVAEACEANNIGDASVRDYNENVELYPDDAAFCGICDDGGELLFCEGPCKRSFHATKKAAANSALSQCTSLGYTEDEVAMMDTWECHNCKQGEQQCFKCGKLGRSRGQDQEVFVCSVALCGRFYHPQCLADWKRDEKLNGIEDVDAFLKEVKEDGRQFCCPLHECRKCGKGDDQLAKCRRCPVAYHKQCLPKAICFTRRGSGKPVRAWELGQSLMIYCLKHDIDDNLKTPKRDHLLWARGAAFGRKVSGKTHARTRRQLTAVL